MASYAVVHPEQRKVTLSWWKSLYFGGCCIFLPSSMADFVPCDGITQRAHWVEVDAMWVDNVLCYHKQRLTEHHPLILPDNKSWSAII